ncbi:hypothetical protein CRG98_024143 [Punica granatum]|uniref:Uncharacterized protein n=1 Tax=Punica granatum TaxID=22663 RepID=A0A2I0JH08_PUNGR|nr:hypothetical protein CRG98_024143 [Punica granatum]
MDSMSLEASDLQEKGHAQTGNSTVTGKLECSCLQVSKAHRTEDTTVGQRRFSTELPARACRREVTEDNENGDDVGSVMRNSVVEPRGREQLSMKRGAWAWQSSWLRGGREERDELGELVIAESQIAGHGKNCRG